MSRFAALPLTLNPSPGESATSFASRLAKLNGAPRLITFCSDLGLSHGALTNGEPGEVERIAALAGCDPKSLLFWTPQQIEPRWFKFGRERIKFTAFARTQPRACPICLRESSVHGAGIYSGHPGLWQLSSVRGCALHKCALVPMPAAPSNKDVFDFARVAERYVQTSAEAVPESDLALQGYLAARVAEGPGGRWLDNLPFHVAAQTADNLGILFTLGPDARRAEISDQQWITAGAAGYHVLNEGPDALRQALTDMKRGYVNDTGRYLSRYRFFFDWLRFRDDDRNFDAIRDLVRDFVWKSYPVAKGAKVMGQECPRQFVHSISTAVTKTGITKRQLGRRLCAMGFAQPNGNDLGFDIHDYIPDEVIMEIASDFSGVLNAAEAAAFLGIKRFLLTQLTRPDLIPTFVRDDKALPLYHVSALTSFMATLESLRERGIPEGGWLQIATAANRAKITTEKAVSLIVLHKLPLRCHRAEIAGFRDLLVDVATLREAISLPEEGAVHPARAAQILDVPIKTITAMLKLQYLDSVPVRRHSAIRPILYACPSAVEDFVHMYVTKKQVTGQARDQHDPIVILQLLDEYRIDLGKATEPIYRREVLSAF